MLPGGASYSVAQFSDEEAALQPLVRALRERSALLVMDNGKMVGIFSERDYARKIILKDRTSKQTPVAEVMTPRIVCVSPDEKIEKCMMLMTSKRCRHLPVLEDDQVMGVISIGDVGIWMNSLVCKRILHLSIKCLG